MKNKDTDPQEVLRHLESDKVIHVPLQRILLRQMRKVLWLYHSIDMHEINIAINHQMVATTVLAISSEITA